MSEAAGGFDPSFFLMIGSIFAIFYLLVLRPENKKRKDQEASIKAAGKGDLITTTGGLRGKVTGATDDVVTVEIASLKNGEKIRVKIARSALQSVSKGKEES